MCAWPGVLNLAQVGFMGGVAMAARGRAPLWPELPPQSLPPDAFVWGTGCCFFLDRQRPPPLTVIRSGLLWGPLSVTWCTRRWPPLSLRGLPFLVPSPPPPGPVLPHGSHAVAHGALTGRRLWRRQRPRRCHHAAPSKTNQFTSAPVNPCQYARRLPCRSLER